MPFTIEKVPDAPILILVHESRQLMTEIKDAMEALQAALDAQPEPVFLVLDIHELGIGLDDLPAAASTAARGPGALLHHPNIRESLLVSRAGLIKLGAQGLRSATFGNVKIRVFDTTEQAIEYCREKIAETADR